jgi:hypothetical protein
MPAIGALTIFSTLPSLGLDGFSHIGFVGKGDEGQAGQGGGKQG